MFKTIINLIKGKPVENKYRVTTRKVITRNIYVYADNPQQAEIRAMVGPIERIKQKEAFYRMDEEESPTQVVCVENVSDEEFYN